MHLTGWHQDTTQMSVITGKGGGERPTSVTWWCPEVELDCSQGQKEAGALFTLLCFLLSRLVYLAHPNTVLNDPVTSQPTKQQHRSRHQVSKKPVNSLSHPSNCRRERTVMIMVKYIYTLLPLAERCVSTSPKPCIEFSLG